MSEVTVMLYWVIAAKRGRVDVKSINVVERRVSTVETSKPPEFTTLYSLIPFPNQRSNGKDAEDEAKHG